MSETVDARYFQAPEDRDDAMGRITAAAERLVEAQDAVEAAQKGIEAAAAKVKRINDEIVAAIEDLGIVIPEKGWEFPTRSGRSVLVKESVHGSCSKANQAALIAWLDGNGESGMVKRKLTLEFDREQSEEAAELREKLKEKYPFIDSQEAVNANTLKAWIRRRVKAGGSVPDVVSIEVVKQVSVK